MKGLVDRKYYESFLANFETICISLLIDSYKQSLTDRQFKLEWKEDSFTNYLVTFMRQNPLTAENKLFIKVQTQPENNALPIDGTPSDPDRQPIVDIWFGNWGDKKNEFYIEAKNLSAKNWTKNQGTKVSAYQQRARYIDTGIENFKTGRYPYGCLTGYILQGNAQQCVGGINELLEKRNRLEEKLSFQHIVEDFDDICVSKHCHDATYTELKHIFLEFDR